MSSSMGRMTTHILWKIKNVWNHQPDTIFHCSCISADIPAAQSLACRVSSSKTSSSLSQVVFKSHEPDGYGSIPIKLVVYLPTWKIWVRQIGSSSQLLGNMKNVPNHQPAINTILTGDEQINRWAYINPSNFDVNYRGTRSWPIPISTNIGIQWTQPPSGNDVNQHCDQRWQLSTKSIGGSTILAVEIPTKWQIYSTHLTCHKKNIISCSRFRRWLKFKVYWNPSSIEELSTPL